MVILGSNWSSHEDSKPKNMSGEIAGLGIEHCNTLLHKLNNYSKSFAI